MEIRCPEQFYSLQFKDDYGFYPVEDLPQLDDWSTARCLEFVMCDAPISTAVQTGYGIYLEHEDFWVFGKSPEEAFAVAEEWPEDDAE